MKPFLMFDVLIAPWIIRIVAWVAAVVVLLGGLKVLVRNDFAGGILIMVLGPIAVRLVAEILLVPFKIYEAVAAKKCEGAEIVKQG